MALHRGARSAETAGVEHRLDVGFRDVPDVALAGVKGVDFPLIDVETDDGKPGLQEDADERQTDIAKPDNADGRGPVLDPRQRPFKHTFGHTVSLMKRRAWSRSSERPTVSAAVTAPESGST